MLNLYMCRHLPDDYAVRWVATYRTTMLYGESPPTGRLCLTCTCVATYRMTMLYGESPPTGRLCFTFTCVATYRTTMLYGESPPTGRLCLTCTCVATYRTTMLNFYMCRHLPDNRGGGRGWRRRQKWREWRGSSSVGGMGTDPLHPSVPSPTWRTEI